MPPITSPEHVPAVESTADAPHWGVSRTGSPGGPLGCASRDPRALQILAKTLYRELRQSGLVEEDVMAVAGELLSLVAGDVHERRQGPTEGVLR